MKKVSVDAPCKINIHLDVKERRADGYHNIESIFQLISLCDTLIATKIEEDECCVICREMILPADNTIARAFNIFKKQTGIKGGAFFELVKRVPSGAGLGGGSSDGAAALRALDALYGTRLSANEMEKIALKIGSDCPFFIRGGAALVSGRGEKLFRFSKAQRLFGVLIWPSISCPTKEAYALLDLSRASSPVSQASGESAAEDAEIMLSRYLKAPNEWRFFNSFEDMLSKKYPPIKKALHDIRKTGVDFASITGSGSSVFGIFDNERKADNALAALSCAWQRCYKFFFLDFSPNLQ